MRLKELYKVSENPRASQCSSFSQMAHCQEGRGDIHGGLPNVQEL